MDLQLDQWKRGDIITLVGEVEHLHIEKVWLGRQGSYRWLDYETRTHKTQRRVIVGAEFDDGEWETVVYDQFPHGSEIPNAASLPDRVTWNDMTFHRDERGTCTVELIDPPDEPLRCRYADYEGPDDAVLAIEVFGGDDGEELEVEIFVGQSVRPSFVQLFAPADKNERKPLLMKQRATKAASKRTGSRMTSAQQAIIAGVLLAVFVLVIAMVIFN